MADEPIHELEINLLEPNPLQARTMFTSESLADLVSSLKEHGILEPLVIAKTPAGYQIIAGERRWRAAKIVGLKKVPVVVRETTSKGMLEMAIVENVQREDLNPIDRALAFERLLNEFGLGLTEIAQRISKSESYVSNTIRLLKLPDAIKDGLISGATTEGHARAISGLGDTRVMVEAYKTLLTEDGSVRRAEELVRQIRSKQNKAPRGVTTKIHTDELQKMGEEIAKALKARVKLHQSAVQAKLLLILDGNYDDTTKILKKIHDKLLTLSRD